MSKNTDNNGTTLLVGDEVLIRDRTKGIVSKVAKSEDCFDVWVKAEDSESCYASCNVKMVKQRAKA